MSTSVARRPEKAHRTLLAAWALGAAVFWNLANVGAAASAVSAQYVVGLPSVGLFATAMFMGVLLFQIPTGRFVDRFGARKAGLLALTIVIIGNLATMMTSNFLAALAFRTLVGIGLGMGFIAGAAAVRSAGGSSLAQGIYGGICMAGAGLGIAVVGSLVQEMGWRTPFATGVIVGCVGLPAVLFAPKIQLNQGAANPPLLQVLRDRRLLRFAWAQATTFGLSAVIGNWVVPLLVVQNTRPTVAAWVGSLTLLGALVGRPLGGWISSQAAGNTKRMVSMSMLSGSAGTLMLTLGSHLGLGLAGALLVGLSAGIPFGPICDAVTKLRWDAPALALSVMVMPAIAMILIGTPLVGLGFELPGHGRLGFFVMALLWASTALVLPREWGSSGASSHLVGCPQAR